MTALPEYTEQELSNQVPAVLINLIIENEDRVPRNLIDACAKHGDEMVNYLQRLHDSGDLWQKEGSNGKWWLRLHTAMILGLIPGEQAGLLLPKMMHRMAIEEDDNLQEWLAGHWTQLFINKLPGVLNALRDLGMDASLNCYSRYYAVETATDLSAQLDEKALDEALAWVAGIATNEEEDWELRLFCSSKLLDYPREEYRALLENMASRQSGWVLHFDEDDINKAYAEPNKRSRYLTTHDAWSFYNPQAIADRQQRWAKEDEQAKLHSLAGTLSEDDLYFSEVPFIRPEPKTGRNDPCPCGSGKKFKKCCQGK
jgi:hypothetical protein